MTQKAAVVCSLLLTAILGGCGSAGEPAGFCGWIGTDVDGLDRIETVDGTVVVGTWYHVFAEGVTDATDDSRAAIAAAIAGDDQGFQRLMAEAPSDVALTLERLRQLLEDPRSSADRRQDPAVLADVALIDAQGCDFLRTES